MDNKQPENKLSSDNKQPENRLSSDHKQPVDGKQPLNITNLTKDFGGSKYSLVTTVAKRARQLTEGSSPRVEPASNKPVVIALQEIAAGEIVWDGPTGGIK